MGGRSADMFKINKLATSNGITVIEDAAQALGSTHSGIKLGTQSSYGCFSLSVTKIISTGQGGFISTSDPEIYKKLIAVRTHGVGDILNAKWEIPGFNFRFTDVLASIGKAQMRQLPARLDFAKQIYKIYETGLHNTDFIKIIPVNLSEGEIPVYVEALSTKREALIGFLASNGVQCRPFYPNLDKAAYFNCPGQFPNSDRFEQQGIYLPSGPSQTLEDIERVVDLIQTFAKQGHRQ